ncbi:MAG: transglutaminase-like domain-containing protein [Clostridiales Family XIII bacterium]|nr:transglutaminase-like domain-containing protein [Clostridiales Family XIII bacterium]
MVCLSAASCDAASDVVNNIKDTVIGEGLSVKENPEAPDRDNTPQILAEEATGTATFGGDGCTVDYSNASDGYILIAYEGTNPKVKVQIKAEGNDPYTYDLVRNAGFQAFPLSMGSGTYEVGVFTNVSGDQYAQAAKQTITAEIADEFSPFLHANQYSNFTGASACVSKAQAELSGVKTDLGATERIYKYVVDNIVYDYEEAATVQSGYIPDPDLTLSTGKGICFDYASLTTAMLRSQGIPCKLVVGYAGTAYHAWISVYSRETGKVMSIINFSQDQWNRMDPTFTASGDRADPNVVGDGTTYNPIYYY